MTGPSTLLDCLDSAASGGDGTVHLVRTGEAARWSSIWRDAHRCAAWITRTMPRDHTIAGLLEPSRSCLVTLLGWWLAGRAFASLPHRSRGMDADQYKDHTKALVELAGAGLVVTPPELSGFLDGVRQLTYDDFGRRDATTGSDRGTLIQFTSGSTDRPRGVVLGMEHLGAQARALSESVGTSAGDVYFSWLPLSHDMGLVGMCLAPLAVFSPELGGPSHLWLSDPQRFMRDPLSWLRLASDASGTVTAAPNFALELVARRLRRQRDPLDLSSLRCLIVGSETVSAATLRKFTAAAAVHGFREDALCPAYGLAEATLAVAMVRPGAGWKTLRDGMEDEDGERVALGPPVPEMRVRTRPNDRTKAGDETEQDGFEEIEIAGPSVTNELLGRPGEVTSDGWLRTGDLGFLHDGELYFASRTHDRIVVAGRNLDAGGLQRQLASAPGVRDGCCAVISEGDHDFAVVFEAARSRDSGDVRTLCRSVSEAAVRYAGATPARVLVVGRGQVPKTPSGKLQPHLLQERLAEGAVVPLAEVTARSDVHASSRPEPQRLGEAAP